MDLASAAGRAFEHPFRAQQLQGAVRWLSRNRPAILARGGAYPLAFRRDFSGTTLLGLFNLTLDPWPGAEFELWHDRKVDRVERLTPRGRWAPDPSVSVVGKAPNYRVRREQPLAFSDPLFLTLWWK